MNSKFKNYLALSISLHVVLFFSMYLTTALKSFIKKSEPVEITLLTPEQFKQLEKIDPLKNAQIVETDANTANLQKDDKAKLLSEKNNVVKKQSLAKFDQTFKNVQKRGSKSTAQEQKAVQAQAKSKPQLFNQTFDPYAALAKKTLQQELKNFAQGQNSLAKGDVATSNDKVDDVRSDLVTLLNTREYKYYGFYHRIKTQLNQWWQPKVREKVTKMMRQGRSIASDTSKETRLVIVLNEKGTLIKIQVLNPSGIRDLDDAAVEAFRSAAPFPNPPKGIIDGDGTVKIPWNFVIES